MWSASYLAPHLSTSATLLKQVKSWKLDSRLVQPGDLYVALRGKKVDGHQFLKEVHDRGAKAALIEKDYQGDSFKGLELIRVSSVSKTLQFLAKKLIEIWKPKIIGVTGSIGKTTTKEFIYTLLSSHLDIYKSFGNHNSQLTLPLTILNSPRPTQWLLLEMGMDRPGELDRLLDIAPPDYSIVTFLAHVHIEAFESFEHLALEKLKLFELEKTKAGIYPLEMPFSNLAKHHGGNKKITTSLINEKADYCFKKSSQTLLLYYKQKKIFDCQSPLQDPKSALNLLHAIALAHIIGLSFDQIRTQIPKIKYPEKRMQFIECRGVYFLNDAYNSCVDSVENALEALPKATGKKIAVLSEMVDQGPYSVENHQKLTQVELKHVDHWM